MYLTRTCSDN